ncbi:MAG: tRNA glutamyl-Q synthetase, partial [Bacteroidetes bacterium]|nr:tRNA glutamyl-Q synthetase [Bacteroidota bacterium]
TTLPHYNKTRLAPTPSGYLHLGNALSFAITADLARRTGAKVLLRIDDLDRERMEKAYVEDIFETLRFLGIDWEEGPQDFHAFETRYSQLHRMPLYNEALQKLKAGGHVYACTCSRSQVLRQNPDGIYPGTCRHKNIPLDTPDASWRLHTEAAGDITVYTPSGETITAQLPPSMHDFIVRKKDEFPAYQLSSVVDDVHFGIDLIVRGEDLWDSTLAQLYLASLLDLNDFTGSSFYHHPLLTTADGEKLSKSAGATSIQWLRAEGKTASEVYALFRHMPGA